MFNYEIFDVIFKKSKKSCNSNLSDLIDLNQKYKAGRYEIKSFLCSTNEIQADVMTAFLNLQKPEFSKELKDWSEFELCTGVVDYDIMMCCFYTESDKEKETDQFVSLAIN